MKFFKKNPQKSKKTQKESDMSGSKKLPKTDYYSIHQFIGW